MIVVVGPSGVGKDSLIAYARKRLAESERIVFAHRYITRPSTSGGENHIELNAGEFAQRGRLGLFAMTWDSHGYRYGVGIEIDGWLAKGLRVVVNGSRDYVSAVRERYPDIAIVWVSADPANVEARLRDRGRESRAEVEARLKRNSRLGVHPPAGVLTIDNDGTLEEGGERLVALLTL